MNTHPWRPRGSQSGWEKRRDNSFQVRAKEPLPKIQVDAGFWLGTNNALYYCAQSADSFSWVLFVSSYTTAIREFKIQGLRTRTMVKHATAHCQTHVTVHFSRVFQLLWWVVELFRVVATMESICLYFAVSVIQESHLFRKKEGSEICKLCLISAQIYAFNLLEPLKFVTIFISKTNLMFK